MGETTSACGEEKDTARREQVLLAYYSRLNEIDENNRDLTSFFFAVDTAILVLVFQVLKEDWQRLVLASVGYFASVALALIGYKSFWSWRTYAKEMRRLEDELGFDISAKYDAQLRRSPARSVRVTLVRLRFNFLFLVLWLLILGYLLFAIPAPWLISPQLRALSGVMILAAIVCLPWAYLIGTLRPATLWAVFRAPWARDV
jgi:hypothetical protein